MKIAVPVNDGLVNSHFGHTGEFSFYYVEEGKIVKKEVIKAPQHKPGVIPRYLYLEGVTDILASKIGDSAKRILDALQINYITGVKGDSTDNVEAFLTGYLEVSEEVGCCGHEDGESKSCCGHSSDDDCHGSGKERGCCSHKH